MAGGPRADRITAAIALLFATGSVLFALGSLPPYFENVPASVVASTFFVGSVFFTAAALTQFLQSRGDRAVVVSASVVQLVGTVFFNVTTFAATLDNLTTRQEERLVWAPDAVGSVAFLLAGALGWSAVCSRLWCWRPASSDWRMAALNMLGAVAFGLAAVGAFLLPTTGEPVNITWVNVGTFVGACCFLWAALILLRDVAGRPSAGVQA